MQLKMSFPSQPPKQWITTTSPSIMLCTLWCLIEEGVGIVGQGGWKNPQNLISRGVGINGGLENFLKVNK